MGFFDFLKPRSKENIESCWPGGKFLQVHIEYDTIKAVFTYFGRYGLKFSVPKDNLTHVVVKEVSRTHSVLQLYSGEDCVGTSDLLPTEEYYERLDITILMAMFYRNVINILYIPIKEAYN